VHISANNLVNARDQAYVNVAADNVLATVLGAGGSEFMKREELIRRVLEKMQAWHEIRIEGKDPLLKCADLYAAHCNS
jgi:translation initiation factor 2D